ncbi:YihA family ribosome biogenesis GTP-binding protein, partial [Acidithiobacillus ferrooxidans]|nr:YihA family ribosome biogenesis GTP-binding protein [Acidithiobacillus ferrooxidans]
MDHTNPNSFRFAPLRRAAYRLSVTQAGHFGAVIGGQL